MTHQEGRKPRLQIKSVEEDVITRFFAAVGCGWVYGPYDYEYKDGHVRRPYYVWIADGSEALKAAILLTPYLSERTTAKLAVLGDQN